MSDRELLELAAKAVGGTNGKSNGLFYQWRDLPHTGVDRVLRYCGQREWNPLKDDGDALRLAVKLRIDVEWASENVVFADNDSEPAEADPYAATRRAIVRAAAEIGRTPPPSV
jgi:hypothetical protein